MSVVVCAGRGTVRINDDIGIGTFHDVAGGLHHGLVAAFPEFGGDVVGVCNDRVGGFVFRCFAGALGVSVGGHGGQPAACVSRDRLVCVGVGIVDFLPTVPASFDLGEFGDII